MTSMESRRGVAEDSARLSTLGEFPAARGDQVVIESLDGLGALLGGMGVRRVLLVLDRGAAEASGSLIGLADQLASLRWSKFEDFSPNPTSEQAAAAARAAGAIGAEAIVAFGGGSCNDVAKVAALSARTPDLIDALSRGGVSASADPLPLVTIPTTSGTGSEATHFAAIYVDGRKVSVAHPKLRPAAVVLDVRLHMAMPPALAACTGLDALGQAIESLWAVGSTEESWPHAIHAGRLAAGSLVESVRLGTEAARRSMMRAANLAGHAINISKTTASHALSYQLTQRFKIPHGCAVALTLGHLAAVNAGVSDEDCVDPRGADWVRERVSEACSLLGVTPASMPGRVAALLGDLGLAVNLEEAGVARGSLAEMAEAVDPVRLGNNPRRLNTSHIEALLERAWSCRPD